LIRSFLFTGLFFIGLHSIAQYDTIHLKEVAHPAMNTEKNPQAIFLQVGGSAPFLSLKYDRRFKKRKNGFGFNIGFGLFGFEEQLVKSIPFSINFLAGKSNHFVEVGAGASFVTATVSWFRKPIPGNGFIYHTNFGYRHQPSKGGFLFRVGLAPVFGPNTRSGYFLSSYMGLGFTFPSARKAH
jgi:hypothetical protein